MFDICVYQILRTSCLLSFVNNRSGTCSFSFCALGKFFKCYSQSFKVILINMCSPDLRLFSESAQSFGVLKGDLAEAKKLLGARNKQLHQLWYRSVTLQHIISLLDQLEGIANVCLLLEVFVIQ